MIPAWVAEYVGIPWREHGRDRAGVDCWGLLRLVLLEQRGIELPSYAGDYTSPSERDEIAALLRHEMPALGWAPVQRPLEGDGVVFRLLNAPWHVGLMVDAEHFLHVDSGRSGGLSCIELLAAPIWNRRIYGFYRLEAA